MKIFSLPLHVTEAEAVSRYMRRSITKFNPFLFPFYKSQVPPMKAMLPFYLYKISGVVDFVYKDPVTKIDKYYKIKLKQRIGFDDVMTYAECEDSKEVVLGPLIYHAGKYGSEFQLDGLKQHLIDSTRCRLSSNMILADVSEFPKDFEICELASPDDEMMYSELSKLITQKKEQIIGAGFMETGSYSFRINMMPPEPMILYVPYYVFERSWCYEKFQSFIDGYTGFYFTNIPPYLLSPLYYTVILSFYFYDFKGWDFYPALQLFLTGFFVSIPYLTLSLRRIELEDMKFISIDSLQFKCKAANTDYVNLKNSSNTQSQSEDRPSSRQRPSFSKRRSTKNFEAFRYKKRIDFKKEQCKSNEDPLGLYDRLGLEPDINYTDSEVKQAYKLQVRQNHPDLFQDLVEKEIATQKFAEIVEAWEKLRKTEDRERYRKFLTSRHSN